VSLFSTVLTNALEQQKINIIQHFESRFDKNDKQTGVEAGDVVFKHEGNRIQHSFNSERADKLAKLESLIKIKDLTAASKLLTEEREILRKRNKILEIADKHGWDTVQEYLDSPLADDKDDPANLRTAIARATTKRRSKPYDRTAERANISDKFASRGGAKFNARNFYRGFSQFNGDGSRDNNNSSLENVSTVINKDTTLEEQLLRAAKPNLCVVFLCAHMSETRNILNSDELARENLSLHKAVAPFQFAIFCS
jgi:hypothetical protein